MSILRFENMDSSETCNNTVREQQVLCYSLIEELNDFLSKSWKISEKRNMSWQQANTSIDAYNEGINYFHIANTHPGRILLEDIG